MNPLNATLLMTIALTILQPIQAFSCEEHANSSQLLLSDYSEFSDFQQDQKQYYLKKVRPHLTQLDALKDLTSEKLKADSMDEDKWDNIYKTVEAQCKEKSNKSICDKISAARRKALHKYGNQKLENRKAQQISVESDD